MTDAQRLRFLSSFVVTAGGCWEWTKFLRNGYGRFSMNKKYHQAHRLSYEMFVGPIPEGLQIDHLCSNKKCLNPAHLEPVAPRENTIRYWGTQERCVKGHEMTPDNTYPRYGAHVGRCRQCQRDWVRKWKQSRKVG